MTTKISVNVSGGDLVQQSKELQIANRRQHLQKEEDERFLDDVVRIEQAKAEFIAATQSNGAIPEYNVIRETSAQRDAPFTGGWIDVHRLSPDNASGGVSGRGLKDFYTQISVGSGDGRNWQTYEWPTESSVVTGLNIYQDGPYITVPGFRAGVTTSQNAIVDPSELPPNADITTRDPYADEIFSSQENWNLYTDSNKDLSLYAKAVSVPENTEWISYLVYPVDERVAIVTVRGNRMLRRTDRTVLSAVRDPAISVLDDGPVFDIFPSSVDPIFSYGVSLPQYWLIPPGGKEIVVNGLTYLLPANKYLRLTWYYWVLNDQEQVLRSRDSIIDFYAIVESGPQYQTDKQSLNLGFTVSATKVKTIELPTALVDQYEARWPLYDWENVSPTLGPTFDAFAKLPQYVWEETGTALSIQNYLSSCIGTSANARVDLEYGRTGYGWNSDFTDTPFPPTYLMGSPGIFDYAESNFNDWQFSTTSLTDKIVQSAYAPATGTPLFTPDHQVRDSGFKSLFESKQQLASPPDLIMVWLYLTDAQRQESAANYPTYLGLNGNEVPYQWSNIQAKSDPRFNFSLLKNTVDGVVNNNAQCSKFSWVSSSPDDQANCYMKDELVNPPRNWVKWIYSLQLSRQRVLPPSLYVSKLDAATHPYLDPSVAKPSLSMIFWTAWGRSWRAKLLELGFNSSDFAP